MSKMLNPLLGLRYIDSIMSIFLCMYGKRCFIFCLTLVQIFLCSQGSDSMRYPSEGRHPPNSRHSPFYLIFFALKNGWKSCKTKLTPSQL